VSQLNDLYQEIILDHNRRPRNFHKLVDASHTAEGYNPLCGDQVTVYINVVKGKITEIGFQGSGCAISRASASLMTEVVMEKTEQQAEDLFEQFHHMVTRNFHEGSNFEDLGDLEGLAGVAQYPSRVKCASLSWHTLMAALRGREQLSTTES